MDDQTTQRSLKIILLAAGLSRRLEGEQKLLKFYNGKPLFLYSLSSALKTADVILVTGHESQKIISVANEFVSCIPDLKHSLKCVKNTNYSKGQYTSVICGIQNTEDECDFALSVSDAPFVTSSDYEKLYTFLPLYDVVRPFVNGIPCHPVFFKSHLKKLFLNNVDYNSVRSLINDNKDKLKILNKNYTDNDKMCIDFDYAECFDT